MRIEEAILYVLAERNCGLRTEQIADIINRRRLHVRKDGQPVTSTQAYVYKYDGKGRCVSKRLPGCAPVLYRYDKGDVPVFT